MTDVLDYNGVLSLISVFHVEKINLRKSEGTTNLA